MTFLLIICHLAATDELFWWFFLPSHVAYVQATLIVFLVLSCSEVFVAFSVWSHCLWSSLWSWFVKKVSKWMFRARNVGEKPVLNVPVVIVQSEMTVWGRLFRTVGDARRQAFGGTGQIGKKSPRLRDVLIKYAAAYVSIRRHVNVTQTSCTGRVQPETACEVHGYSGCWVLLTHGSCRVGQTSKPPTSSIRCLTVTDFQNSFAGTFCHFDCSEFENLYFTR